MKFGEGGVAAETDGGIKDCVGAIPCPTGFDVTMLGTPLFEAVERDAPLVGKPLLILFIKLFCAACAAASETRGTEKFHCQVLLGIGLSPELTSVKSSKMQLV